MPASEATLPDDLCPKLIFGRRLPLRPYLCSGENVGVHHVRIVPIKVTRYDVPLAVLTRGVVAYRAECSCGERGPSRPNVQAARVWRQSHVGGA
jgi:hypothetical protein